MKYCALFLFVAACGASLTPSDYAEIGDVGAKIAECQAAARACKSDGGSGDDCYAVYDACMKKAGLH